MDTIPCESRTSELSANTSAPSPRPHHPAVPAACGVPNAGRTLRVKIPRVYVVSVPQGGPFDGPVS